MYTKTNKTKNMNKQNNGWFSYLRFHRVKKKTEFGSTAYNQPIHMVKIIRYDKDLKKCEKWNFEKLNKKTLFLTKIQKFSKIKQIRSWSIFELILVSCRWDMVMIQLWEMISFFFQGKHWAYLWNKKINIWYHLVALKYHNFSNI